MELLPSFWPHRAIALGAFVWFGKRGSLTRCPLLPLNAGTAEPVRVSPPEAVAYLLELLPGVRDHRSLICSQPVTQKNMALQPAGQAKNMTLQPAGRFCRSLD